MSPILRRRRPAASPITPAPTAREYMEANSGSADLSPLLQLKVTLPTRSITSIARQANAAMGLVGITGSGKTSLAVTGVEEAWEVYGKITRWYASDLGGWGNKLLSLIRLGICQIWYIRNHDNPFETMEWASQGYWPERMLDPETGAAAPDVRLVPPRQTRWTILCANGHPVASFTDQAQVQATHHACPECGQLTTPANALRIDRAVVRSAGFRDVGLYVYDSMTQMSEAGRIELRSKSARGDLPAGKSGGSALGSADALREGSMVFGTGSVSQVGFMQDRVPVWIANIRAIPDQVLPPIVTFGVERSKGDDESGGIPIFGPKIEGNARTSFVPGWLGNCLYVAKEPHSPPEKDEHGNIKTYHRLWLVNHIDPRDSSSTPIVAKHRGEPLGMLDYLEDSGKPEEAWKVCSLRVFYRMLREQAEKIEARDKAKYPNAPSLVEREADEDEVIESAPAASGLPTSLPTSGRIIRRSRRPGAQAGEMAATVVATDAAGLPSPAEQATPPPSRAAETTASPIVEQLKASLDVAKTEVVEKTRGLVTTIDKLMNQAAPAGNGPALAAPGGATANPPAASSTAPALAASSVNRIRRVPRPPA